MTSPTLSLRAFLTLLLLACMFGGNHVAARFAFNDGVDVATAVTLRSGVSALVVGLDAVVVAGGRSCHDYGCPELRRVGGYDA